MRLQLNRRHRHDMLAFLQTRMAGLLDFGLAGNLVDIHRLDRLIQLQPADNLVDHIVRGSDNQQTMNVVGCQRLTHRLRVSFVGEDGTLYGLYSVVFVLGGGACQNFGALNQQAVVNNSVTTVVKGHADGMVALACAAGSYKSNYFHSITPLTSSYCTCQIPSFVGKRSGIP